jgi:hypothetical protein
VLAGTHNDPGGRFTTLLTWALGLAATIALYTGPANAFFRNWRNR